MVTGIIMRLILCLNSLRVMTLTLRIVACSCANESFSPPIIAFDMYSHDSVINFMRQLKPKIKIAERSLP